MLRKRIFYKGGEKISIYLPPMKNMRHAIEYYTYITRLMEQELISPECGKAILEGIREMGELLKNEALLKDIEEKRKILREKKGL